MTSSENTINILGFPTTRMTAAEIIDTVKGWIIENRKSRHLMALNPIKVCRARKEPDLAEHIRDADLVYPDAFGIAWAMRRFGNKKYHPIPGCDMMMEFMSIAAENGYTVFLIGSKQPVIEKTKEQLLINFPGLPISGIRNGYFSSEQDYDLLLEELTSIKPKMIFVGMGALIQENLIKKIKSHCDKNQFSIPLLMGVGGSFDAITGTVPRPPQWMLSLHLEWFFRLIQQPLRAPRMLALPHFAMLVLGRKWFRLPLDYKYSA